LIFTGQTTTVLSVGALTLLAGQQEGHLACKKPGAGLSMVCW